VLGGQARDHYFAIFEDYGNLGTITLSNLSYERGFSSSTAETLIELKGFPKTEDEDLDLPESFAVVLAHTLNHGPFPGGGPALATLETRVKEVRVDGEVLKEAEQEMPLLFKPFSHARIAFDGSVNEHTEFAAIKGETDEFSYHWKGLTSDSEYSSKTKRLISNLSMPGLTIGDEDVTVNFAGLNGRFNLVETLPKLFLGSSELAFGSFSIKNQKTPDESVEMESLLVSANSSYAEGQIKIRELIKLGKINVLGESYGPGLLDLEFNNLDAQALSDIQEQVLAFYQSEDIYDSDVVLSKLLPIYIGFGEQVLAGNPEFNIRELTFIAPQGTVEGNAQVKFNGHEGITLDDTLALIQGLDAAAELTADESLIVAYLIADTKPKLAEYQELGILPEMTEEELEEMAEEQASQQIEALLLQNLLIRDGEKLRFKASYKEGMALLNGQPVPLMQ